MSRFRRALMLGLMILGWAEEAQRDGCIDRSEASGLLRLVADHLELDLGPEARDEDVAAPARGA